MAFNQNSVKKREFSKYLRSNLDFKAFAVVLEKKKINQKTLYFPCLGSLYLLFLLFFPLPLKIQMTKSLYKAKPHME